MCQSLSWWKNLPIILEDTKLVDLVGPQSWILLKVAGVPDGEVDEWIQELVETPSYSEFQFWLRSLTCVNDCAERNIRLIADFVSSYKDIDMKQSLMLVARSHGKKLAKTLTKAQCLMHLLQIYFFYSKSVLLLVKFTYVWFLH